MDAMAFGKLLGVPLVYAGLLGDQQLQYQIDTHDLHPDPERRPPTWKLAPRPAGGPTFRYVFAGPCRGLPEAADPDWPPPGGRWFDPAVACRGSLLIDEGSEEAAA